MDSSDDRDVTDSITIVLSGVCLGINWRPLGGRGKQLIAKRTNNPDAQGSMRHVMCLSREKR